MLIRKVPYRRSYWEIPRVVDYGAIMVDSLWKKLFEESRMWARDYLLVCPD